MRSDKYLWNVCMELYREMYSKADPPADVDKLIEDGTTKKADWFRDYYLSQEEQDEIYNTYVKKYRLTKREREKVHFEMTLGASPLSVRNEENTSTS